MARNIFLSPRIRARKQNGLETDFDLNGSFKYECKHWNTYQDGKNGERSVNRGFIRELTFPQGGGNAITRRVTLVPRYIPVRARFRTFTCTRWLRSLPRRLSSILPRICIDLVRESITPSCESTLYLHSDQGNLSFSCLRSIWFFFYSLRYVMEFVVWRWWGYFLFECCILFFKYLLDEWFFLFFIFLRGGLLLKDTIGLFEIEKELIEIIWKCRLFGHSFIPNWIEEIIIIITKV